MKASDEFRGIAEFMYLRLHPAASIIAKTGNMHTPILVSYNGPEEVATVEDVKHLDIGEIHELYHQRAKERPTCLVLEVWALKVPERTEAERVAEEHIASGKSLEEHPDRIEAILFNFISGDQQLIAVCPIHRDDNSLEKGPLEDPYGTGSSGKGVLNDGRVLQ